MTRVTGVREAHRPRGSLQGVCDFSEGLHELSVELALQNQRRAVAVP